MPGFTSRDDIITEATTNGKHYNLNFYKIAAQASEGAGIWQSLWRGTGTPGAGSNPATTPGTAYSSDAASPVAGSLWFPDTSTDLKFLTSFGAVANQNVTLMLYDMLVGVSGVAIGSTGSKTINTSAITRYTSTAGASNQVWLDITTASTAAGSITCNSYTAADGSTGNTGTAIALPATASDISTMVQLPLAAGKQGVTAVSTLNVGTAATTAVANLLILRPLAYLPILANQWNQINFLDESMGLPQIFDNATLGLALLPGGAVTTTVWGQISCVYG